jgi:predicted kinase
VYEAIATRLQTIIFATLGTEHIEDESVQRLESRDMDALVRIMDERAAHGAPSIEWRSGQERQKREHPLATYYRATVSRLDESVSRA